MEKHPNDPTIPHSAETETSGKTLQEVAAQGGTVNAARRCPPSCGCSQGLLFGAGSATGTGLNSVVTGVTTAEYVPSWKDPMKSEEAFDKAHGWDPKRTDWWERPSFKAQQAQTSKDGAIQEAMTKRLTLGKRVLFTMGEHRSQSWRNYEMVLAEVIYVTPSGLPTLRVMSTEHPAEDYNLQTPYYTSATPGTILAAAKWSWLPGDEPKEAPELSPEPQTKVHDGPAGPDKTEFQVAVSQFVDSQERLRLKLEQKTGVPHRIVWGGQGHNSTDRNEYSLKVSIVPVPVE